jgi:hypothetical protein
MMSKWFAILIGFGIPLLVWLLTFAAARRQLFSLESMLRVIKTCRWLSLIVATLFCVGYLATAPALSSMFGRFFWCVMLFYINLFLPQQWLQKELRRSTSVGLERSV